MEKEDFKKNSQNEFKNKWHEKKMYGQFVREMLEEIEDVPWKWLVQNDVKVQNEARYVLHKSKYPGQIIQIIKMRKF